jgi:hypothetical protein
MSFKEVALDSLTYPFINWKRFLNLFILVFLSVVFSKYIIIAIVISLITGGYLIRIIESTLEGSNKLPEFSNMKKLLMDGLKYIIVSIIYSSPLFVSLLILGFSSVLNQLNYIVIGIVIGFLVNIIFLMGLTNMVQEKTISGAFQFKRIFKLIKELGWKNYLIYLLFYTLIIEGTSLIISFFSSGLVFVSPSDIPMALENLNSYSLIGFFVLQGITSTYILAFDGRLRGLIYPKRDLIPESHNEL